MLANPPAIPSAARFVLDGDGIAGRGTLRPPIVGRADGDHSGSPDCEMKERVESGQLNAARYETYARLWNDLA